MQLKSFLSLLALTTIFSQGLVLSTKVQAQSSDSLFNMETFTCRELMLASSEDRALIISLFHGFFNGKNNQTAMDVVKTAKITDEIENHCVDNSQKTLMSVFQEYWK
jgi:hypothetical protein